jgi:hypothetical protein
MQYIDRTKKRKKKRKEKRERFCSYFFGKKGILLVTMQWEMIVVGMGLVDLSSFKIRLNKWVQMGKQ